MPIASHLRGFGSLFHRKHCRGRRLSLEPLEDRTVPSILFNSASTASVSDEGGPVLNQVHVELIFWGKGWDTLSGAALRSQTEAAVDSITGSPYVGSLSEYRPTIGSGSRIGSVTIDSTSPASVFSDQNVADLLTANIGNQTLPDPTTDPNLLYAVIPQPGSSSNFGATHSYTSFAGVNVHYLWTTNFRGIDAITYYFSHELAEAVTDPEGTAIQVNPRNDFAWNEIGDGTSADGAQSYSYRVNGYLLQSWFSAADHAYAVPTGQAQNFYVSSSRVLSVNGGQLPNTDDAITIDQANGGTKVTMNGEVAQFDPREFFRPGSTVDSITVNAGSGTETVNVEKSLSSQPITINLGSGTDTVNLSPTTQNLGTLLGAITVNGGSGTGNLDLFDQAVGTNLIYTVTANTIARTGTGSVTYANLSTIAINTSSGANLINLQSTPSGTAVALNGGSGPNTLVGSAADNTWNITGSNSGTLSSANIASVVSFSSMQNLTGGPANNTFVFSDGAGISGSLVSGGGCALDYSAYTTDVRVNLQTGAATGVGGTVTGIQSVKGGGGNNTLVGTDLANTWMVTAANTGNVGPAPVVFFTGFQNLIGGAAANDFVFSDGATVSGNIDGGGGGGLDYSAYTSSVIVDLRTATATGVGGTLVNIQAVAGGNGGGAGIYNILVGVGGNTLVGGMGRRNLLIAGSSASTLTGGDQNDILIGGSTVYDKDVASLMAIMNYWSGSSDDYGTRIGNLLAANGVPLLDATTVIGNGGNNTLNSVGAIALLYTDGMDTIAGFDSNSQKIAISP